MLGSDVSLKKFSEQLVNNCIDFWYSEKARRLRQGKRKQDNTISDSENSSDENYFFTLYLRKSYSHYGIS